MANIGASIRSLRTKHNMKQDELADLLHVTRQTVSNYENGKSEPDLDTLIRIAEIFETDVNTLLDYPAEAPPLKKQGNVKGAMLLILCTVLAYFFLTAYTDAAVLWSSINYDFSFNYVAACFLHPCWLLLLGWTVIFTIEQFAQFPPHQSWYRTIHMIGLVLVLLNIGLYLPITIWSVGAAAEILPSILAGDWTVNPSTTPYGTELFQWHLFFIINHPKLYHAAMTIIGAMLRITKRKNPEVT